MQFGEIMKEIHIDSFSIGFFSDSHGQCDKIDQIIEKHPEINDWFCLGDLTSFEYPWAEKNREVQKWYFDRLNNITLPANKIKGITKSNHDWTVRKGYINIDHEFALEIDKWSMGIKIILPNNSNILIYHSKPADFWEFVNKGITYREIEDDYPFDDDTLGILIGHNHSQWSKNFLETDLKLVSIGAVQQNCYCVFDGKEFEFKKL